MIDIFDNDILNYIGLCYRHCFKFAERTYTELCLQKNCGGVDFNVAAKDMGYLK